MIVTLCCWGIMYLVFLGVGWCGRKIAYLIWKQQVLDSQDGILMAGVVLSTLYAETISLFIPLGAVAALGLLALAGISLASFRNEIVRFLRNRREEQTKGRQIWELALLAVFTCFAAFWTCFDLCDFDNLNYHAQSIRWLEEYGVVKGLVNLHTRLAYNSAFFPLQALFSFAWAGGRSLHALNGFFWVFAMCFCCFAREGKRKEVRRVPLSGVFRVLLLLVVARRGLAGPTPTADFLPLFLTGYVFVKWCELNEKKVEGTAPYILLGLLAVFCATVKLSGAMLVCFCLKPLCDMVSKTQWKALACFVAGCTVIVAPFLVRNVLLSGWLVYPFPALDLFDVDWKIPVLAPLSDCAAIRAYALFGDGWDWSYHYLQNSPVACFSKWFSGIAVLGRVAVVTSFGFYIACGMWGFFRWRQRREHLYDGVIFGTAFAGFVYMLFTAPSLRFGIWWVLIGWVMTCWAIVDIGVRRMSENRRLLLTTGMRILVQTACVLYVTVVFAKLCAVAWLRDGSPRHNWLFPADYGDAGATTAWVEMGGQKFYFRERTPNGPREGGLNGYHGFPGTEYRTTFDLIEMRGDDLSDGFRRRADIRCMGYDFRGRFLEEEELALLGWEP